ncbi:PspC domain-containing protein [Flagellimonas sediminis]|uniref:PspC domain-containing protein n=1 Tax=Flagellimonas sediminis TaxID=2696468 RepID=A0A6I5KYR2_9FLAO|nr:PspC domain-containing protein [Allomuricauda sediminis]NDV42591.1 PspC domain-containing protein [Allomuricauda sediminis]
MDTQKIIQFITRQEKILLGVSSKLALRLNLQPIVIRIVFVVLTLLFIPLGILAYLGGYLILNKMAGKMLILALIGAFLGIPFSYYFQSEMVQRMAGGITGYVKNFVSIVDDVDRFVGNGMDIIWDAMIGVVVFMLIGGAIGYFMDASKRKSGQNDEK